MTPENINLAQRSLQENSKSDAPNTSCRKYILELCAIWPSNETVQEALGVQTPDGTVAAWKTCNDSIIVGPAYDPKATSVVENYKNLTKNNLRGLIYSNGYHDMEISYVGTQKWIWSLNMKLIQSWTPWSVNNETAGFTRKFIQGDFNLTYATGAGHFAPEYKVEERAEMIKRWMVYDTVIGLLDLYLTAPPYVSRSFVV